MHTKTADDLNLTVLLKTKSLSIKNEHPFNQ